MAVLQILGSLIMPQRRPPNHPLPQALIWKPVSGGSTQASPFNFRSQGGRFDGSFPEWAYVTPQYPKGLAESGLVNVSRAEQHDTMRSWFLSNYQPLGPDPWFSFGVEGAGFGQAPFPPPSWLATTLIDEEFGQLLSIDVRSAVAAEFAAISPAWCSIPDLVAPVIQTQSVSAAPDLAAIVIELTKRLDRLEKLQEQARHGVGGNQGPSFIDLSEPVETTRQALAEGGAEGVAKGKTALSVFTAYLPDLGKGAAQGTGKFLAEHGLLLAAPIAVWLFTEVIRVATLLGQWIDLSSLK